MNVNEVKELDKKLTFLKTMSTAIMEGINKVLPNKKRPVGMFLMLFDYDHVDDQGNGFATTNYVTSERKEILVEALDSLADKLRMELEEERRAAPPENQRVH